MIQCDFAKLWILKWLYHGKYVKARRLCGIVIVVSDAYVYIKMKSIFELNLNPMSNNNPESLVVLEQSHNLANTYFKTWP